MSDEQSSRVHLSRRKVLGGLTALGAAGAASGAGTFAYFQDTASSTGNSVTAGTLGVNIHDGNSLEWTISGAPGKGSGYQDVIVEHNGTVPADHLEIEVSNTAVEDNNGDETDGLTAGPESDTDTTDDGSNTDPLGADSGAAGMAKHVKVQDLWYSLEDSAGSDNYSDKVKLVDDGSIVTDSGAVDASGDDHQLSNVGSGRVTLYDLANNDSALDNFEPPTVSGRSGKLFINLEVSKTMGDKYQGDILFTDISFTLNQDSSQDQ